MKIISVKNLTYSYTPKRNVLNSISFDIPEGSIVGLLGENGAGKTTLFDLIYGSLPTKSENIELNVSSDEIAYMPQVVTLPPALKIREIVEMMGCFQRQSMQQVHMRLNSYWSEPMLARYEAIMDRRSGFCSYGEKRWLTISVMLAIFSNIKVFILDEPTVGIDVQYRYLIWSLIKKINHEGITLIVSSHILSEIEANTDYFILLKKSGVEEFSNMQSMLDKYQSEDADAAFIKATLG